MALILAIPASAATYSMQFLKTDGTPSTQLNTFIEGGVVNVTGSPGNYIVTIKMKNVSGGFTYFTFSGVKNLTDLPILLYIHE